MTRLALPLLTLLTVPLLVSISAGPAHSASSCRGDVATVEGDGDLMGTEERGVIVSTGDYSTTVTALGGNDLICVYGGARVLAGDGDDVVDTSVADGGTTYTDLGPGSDTFLGGPGRDAVNPGPGLNNVLTQGGPDELYLDSPATDYAQLGSGSDYAIVIGGAPNGGAIDLGDGEDTLELRAPVRRDSTVHVNPGSALFVVDGDAGYSSDHAERLIVSAGRVTVEGSGEDDDITASGCRILLRGADGDDRMDVEISEVFNPICRPKSRIYGGKGDDLVFDSPGDDKVYGGKGRDVLRSGRGDDVLIGGLGRDLANGGRGRDHCDAEIERMCER